MPIISLEIVSKLADLFSQSFSCQDLYGWCFKRWNKSTHISKMYYNFMNFLKLRMIRSIQTKKEQKYINFWRACLKENSPDQMQVHQIQDLNILLQILNNRKKQVSSFITIFCQIENSQTEIQEIQKIILKRLSHIIHKLNFILLKKFRISLQNGLTNHNNEDLMNIFQKDKLQINFQDEKQNNENNYFTSFIAQPKSFKKTEIIEKKESKSISNVKPYLRKKVYQKKQFSPNPKGERKQKNMDCKQYLTMPTEEDDKNPLQSNHSDFKSQKEQDCGFQIRILPIDKKNESRRVSIAGSLIDNHFLNTNSGGLSVQKFNQSSKNSRKSIMRINSRTQIRSNTKIHLTSSSKTKSPTQVSFKQIDQSKQQSNVLSRRRSNISHTSLKSETKQKSIKRKQVTKLIQDKQNENSVMEQINQNQSISSKSNKSQIETQKNSKSRQLIPNMLNEDIQEKQITSNNLLTTKKVKKRMGVSAILKIEHSDKILASIKSVKLKNKQDAEKRKGSIVGRTSFFRSSGFFNSLDNQRHKKRKDTQNHEKKKTTKKGNAIEKLRTQDFIDQIDQKDKTHHSLAKSVSQSKTSHKKYKEHMLKTDTTGIGKISFKQFYPILSSLHENDKFHQSKRDEDYLFNMMQRKYTSNKNSLCEENDRIFSKYSYMIRIDNLGTSQIQRKNGNEKEDIKCFDLMKKCIKKYDSVILRQSGFEQRNSQSQSQWQ